MVVAARLPGASSERRKRLGNEVKLKQLQTRARLRRSELAPGNIKTPKAVVTSPDISPSGAKTQNQKLPLPPGGAGEGGGSEWGLEPSQDTNKQKR